MIWVVGASGMLGRELTGLLHQSGMPFVGTDRETDFTSLAALTSFVKDRSFTWIVNCAAYTAVDKAEDDREMCHNLNALGPKNLGVVASLIGARVLHISTDYVFDGNATEPYVETDAVRPLTVYGQTKAEGEALLLGACSRAIILRTAWLYGIHGPNFVATMLRLMKEKDSLGVVADQYGAPTWAADLASVILKFLSNPPQSGGIFHASGEGITTWFEFAQAIYEVGRRLGLLDPAKHVEIRPLGTAAYPTRAKRPAWSVLSKDKLKSEMGLEFPLWKESLNGYLRTILQERGS